VISLKKIGGEKVKVVTLSDGRFDLHFVEPRPSMLMHEEKQMQLYPLD